MIAVRVHSLPAPGTTLPILSGGAASAVGHGDEAVQIYSNGGVGALGVCGTAESAIKPGRWAWVVITRTRTELITYVDGRTCAVVKLSPRKPARGAEGDGAGDAQAGGRGRGNGDGGKGDGGGDGGGGGGAVDRKGGADGSLNLSLIHI